MITDKLEGDGLAPNITINQGFGDETIVTVGAGWQTIVDTPMTVRTLKLRYDDGSGGGCFDALRADGKLLVDPIYDSEVWSTAGTITNEQNGFPVANAFDGNLTSYWAASDGTVSRYTFPSIQTGTKFEVFFAFSISANSFTVNGIVPANTADKEWKDVTDAVVASGKGGLQYIEIGYTAAQWGQFIYGIRIDGEIVVDKGIRESGDSKVSTVLPKQGEGTISDITGSVVTIEPFTDNCFKEGQYLINATPKPILITPKTDAITDATGDVLTFSGSKDLLNFAAGDTVSMCNADGSAATVEAETSEIVDISDDSDFTVSNHYKRYSL